MNVELLKYNFLKSFKKFKTLVECEAFEMQFFKKFKKNTETLNKYKTSKMQFFQIFFL